jgi:hypothetical protein
MAPVIVNPAAKFRPPTFLPPPPSGWLYLAASVAPPQGPPFVRRNARRAAVLAGLTGLVDAVSDVPRVTRVSVFRAVLIPPVGRGVRTPARFDVAVLVRTESVDDLDAVRTAVPLEQMRQVLHDASATVHEIGARCSRLLGEVEHERRGLYLFNHFTAASGAVDESSATQLWEHLAGWYVAETGLRNSTLLAPVEPDDYLFVNHASWRTGPLRLALAQFRKQSFRSYVRANLAANRVVAMPVLYRLAASSAPARRALPLRRSAR